MSAFIVPKAHIDTLVQAGLTHNNIALSWRHDDQWHELDHTTDDQVGAMLWTENVRSVVHRYPGDRSLPGTYEDVTLAEGTEPITLPEWLQAYRFQRRAQRSPVEVLKAIDCFEYQSCEHDEWEESEAFAFCGALRSSMIGQLPGYDEAPWSID